MEADTVVEGHPVAYRRRVVLSPEGGVPLFVGNGIYTVGGSHAAGGVAGYEIGLQRNLSVLIVIEVLVAQVDLHIGVADAGILAARRRLLVDGFALHIIPGLDQRNQLCGLILLIDAPAVGAALNLDGASGGGLELLDAAVGIAAGSQILHILGDHGLVDSDIARFIEADPLMDLVAVEHLGLIAELIGDIHDAGFIKLFHRGVESRVVLLHRCFFIHPGLVQNQNGLQVQHGIVGCFLKLCLIDGRPLGLGDHLIALAVNVIRDIGIFRTGLIGPVHAGQGADLPVERRLVKIDHRIDGK